MNTYEINNRNEVIPYTSGRKCTDTRAWRDATELELQQRDEINNLNQELVNVSSQRDELRESLVAMVCCAESKIEPIESLYQAREILEKLKEPKSECV